MTSLGGVLFPSGGVGGGGGGGVYFDTPPLIFTGAAIADTRTARDAHFHLNDETRALTTIGNLELTLPASATLTNFGEATTSTINFEGANGNGVRLNFGHNASLASSSVHWNPFQNEIGITLNVLNPTLADMKTVWDASPIGGTSQYLNSALGTAALTPPSGVVTFGGGVSYADHADLVKYSSNQFLAILLRPTTGSEQTETYLPGNAGDPYDNTQWVQRGAEGPQGAPGSTGNTGPRGPSIQYIYQNVVFTAPAPTGLNGSVGSTVTVNSGGFLTAAAGAWAIAPTDAPAGQRTYAQEITVASNNTVTYGSVFALSGQTGNTGVRGTSVQYIYQNATTAPGPASAAAPVTVDQTTGVIATATAPWTLNPSTPGTGQHVYVQEITVDGSNNITYGTVSRWSGLTGGTGPQGNPGVGTQGVQGRFTIRQYQNALETSAPTTAPTGGSFNVGTGVLTPSTNWTASPTTAAQGQNIYISEATIDPVSQSGVVVPTWSVPYRGGNTGPKGDTGDRGISVQFIYQASVNSPTPAAAGTPVTVNTTTGLITGATSPWLINPPTPGTGERVFAQEITVATDNTITYGSVAAWQGVTGLIGPRGPSIQYIYRNSDMTPTPASSGVDYDTNGHIDTVPAGWSLNPTTAPSGQRTWAQEITVPATGDVTYGAVSPWSGYSGEHGTVFVPSTGVSQADDTPNERTTFTLSPDPAWTEYTPGRMFSFYPLNDAQRDIRVNISGLGVRDALRIDGTRLAPQTNPATRLIVLMVTTTDFRRMNGEDGQDGSAGTRGYSAQYVYQAAAAAPAGLANVNGNAVTQVDPTTGNILAVDGDWLLTPPANVPTGQRVYAQEIGVTGSNTVDYGNVVAWTGLDGAAGTGTQGPQGRFTIQQFQNAVAASAPTTAPTGGSFNLNTNVLTPSTGWTASPTTGGANENTYISEATINPATQSGTVTPTWSVPYEGGSTGPKGNPGDAGARGVSVQYIYQAHTASPTPAGSTTPVTVNATSGLITAATAPWQINPPTPTSAQRIYAQEITVAADNSITYGSVVAWSGPAGGAGTRGASIQYIYQNTATPPTALNGTPGNIVTVGSDGFLTGASGGWTINPTAATSGQRTYVQEITVEGDNSVTYGVAVPWSGVPGDTGVRGPSIQYIYHNGAAAPQPPAAGVSYDANGFLNSVPAGWTLNPVTAPSGQNTYAQEITVPATGAVSYGSVAQWSGPLGTDGDDGARGVSVQFIYQSATASPTPADNGSPVTVNTTTGLITAATSPWVINPPSPVANQRIYAQEITVAADNTITYGSVAPWEGPAGSDGIRGVSIQYIYQNAGTSPQPASSGVTYDANGILNAAPSPWSLNPSTAPEHEQTFAQEITVPASGDVTYGTVFALGAVQGSGSGPVPTHKKYFGWKALAGGQTSVTIVTADLDDTLARVASTTGDSGTVPPTTQIAYGFVAVPATNVPTGIFYPPNPTNQIVFFTQQTGQVNDGDGEAHVVFVTNSQLPVRATGRTWRLEY